MAVGTNFLKKSLKVYQSQKFENIPTGIDQFTLENKRKILPMFSLRVFSRAKIFNLLI